MNQGRDHFLASHGKPVAGAQEPCLVMRSGGNFQHANELTAREIDLEFVLAMQCELRFFAAPLRPYIVRRHKSYETIHLMVDSFGYFINEWAASLTLPVVDINADCAQLRGHPASDLRVVDVVAHEEHDLPLPLVVSAHQCR